jgi:hypothetical protein
MIRLQARRWGHAGVIGLAVALLAGACSSSTSKTSASSSSTGASTGATAPAAGTGAASGASKVINLALVTDVTGALSPIAGPARYTIEAALKEANANGGVNGYTFKWKFYDAQSTPAGGLAVARQAIADHAFAVVANSQGLDAGLATLDAAKLPTVGDGDSPNWSNRPYIFGISGNLITQNTTAWPQVLINMGKTKIAVPGGTINPGAVTTWEQMVPFAGGKLCFGRVGIDGTNTATLVSVAHQIISAGCQGIINPTLYPGAEALQAALNQLGADIPEVQAADIGPAVVQQYGKSIDNMIYANFFASPYATEDPGVQQYMAAMAKYEPGRETHCFCIKGYAIGLWFLHAFRQMTANGVAPTQAGLVAALNGSSGFDANGLIPPVEEPLFHTQGALCLSYSVIKNGQWESLIKGPNPFFCGKRFVSS